MRLFIAINIPKKEKDRIHRAARELRDRDYPVRWVRPDLFHLTLKFLGDVQPESRSKIEGAMEARSRNDRVFSHGDRRIRGLSDHSPTPSSMGGGGAFSGATVSEAGSGVGPFRAWLRTGDPGVSPPLHSGQGQRQRMGPGPSGGWTTWLPRSGPIGGK